MVLNPMSKLTVTYNGTPILEYDRRRVLSERQAEYLDRMDETMDGGITIMERDIESPDQRQRLEFVAGQLYQAVANDKESIMAAMCSYIATRQADAREIRLVDGDGEVEIEILLGDDDGKTSGIPVTLRPRPH